MDFLNDIPLIGGSVHTILAFLIVLSVVVFVHEMGHYLVGRWCGIGAEVFSIGFGKEIYGWTDRRGTRWRVSVLPLGGYVKFVGDSDPASAGRIDTEMTPEDHNRSFHAARLWKRALTVAAGPVFNFILSILVFAGLAIWQGGHSEEPVIAVVTNTVHEDLGLEVGDRVLEVAGVATPTMPDVIETLVANESRRIEALIERGGARLTVPVYYHRYPMIDRVVPGGKAAGAGLTPGDVITHMNGVEVGNFRDLQVMIAEQPLRTEVTLTVRRGAETLELAFVPDVVPRAHPVSGETVPLPTLGINGASYGGVEPAREAVGPLLALEVGAVRTWAIITGTLGFIADMVTGRADLDQLGGPIRIAEVSGDAAAGGVAELIFLIATISTSIGLLNLFPIPVLDGGHLVFYAAEAVRGRPLGERWLRAASAVGLTLVLLLMAFATYNDLARF